MSTEVIERLLFDMSCDFIPRSAPDAENFIFKQDDKLVPEGRYLEVAIHIIRIHTVTKKLD